jgi:hydrogenase expression/formation protein HypD
MKFVDEFQRSDLVKGLVGHIRDQSHRKVRIMEFCGGHTIAILKYGLRQLLPPTIEMVSGPGCPVCVTDNADIDKAIALAAIPGLILTTFGDMLKVPGSRSSLQEAKATGADVRIVYSTVDALSIARQNPQRPVAFLGVGFETTAPTIAASVLMAEREGIKNYYVLSLSKLCPPVIKVLLDAGETRLNGLICPGHVSAVTGSRAWDFISRDYHIPCVVSGFEPLDILQCIAMLVSQVESGRSEVEIAYKRGVTLNGNNQAMSLMEKVFEPAEAIWRGIGPVAASGHKLRAEYGRYDAERKFEIKAGDTLHPAGCICGDILRGIKTPPDCRLFRKICRPESPVGPCMVSAEGSCAAYYLYGEEL